MRINTQITETLLNTERLVNIFIEGETHANEVVFELQPDTVLDLSALTYVLIGTTQKDNRTEIILVKNTTAGRTTLTWDVDEKWTAVSGGLNLEIIGQDSGGHIIKKWLGSHTLMVKPTLGTGTLPQPDIMQQYLTKVRTDAIQVSQNLATVTAIKEAVATDAVSVAVSVAAAADSATTAREKATSAATSATTAREKATSAATSAATAKAEADRATAIVGFDGSYGVLTGKPKINNVELLGNKTLAELGAAAQTEVTANTQARHTHGNKGVLDGITAALVAGWNGAVDHVTDAVKHITAAERSLWNTVSSKADKAEVSEELSQKANVLTVVSAGSINDLLGKPSGTYLIQNGVQGMPKDGAAWLVSVQSDGYSCRLQTIDGGDYYYAAISPDTGMQGWFMASVQCKPKFASGNFGGADVSGFAATGAIVGWKTGMIWRIDYDVTVTSNTITTADYFAYGIDVRKVAAALGFTASLEVSGENWRGTLLTLGSNGSSISNGYGGVLDRLGARPAYGTPGRVHTLDGLVGAWPSTYDVAKPGVRWIGTFYLKEI